MQGFFTIHALNTRSLTEAFIKVEKRKYLLNILFYIH